MSQNFTINQGATIAKPFYWYSDTPVSVAITAITLTYPPVFSAAGHGMPADQIPVTLASIRGPSRLNTEEGATVYALKLTSGTFSVPELNASGMNAYTGGGYVRYFAPTDVTGFSARMHLRRSVNSSTVLADWNSDDGQLIVGTTNGKIVLSLTDEETAELDFNTAVYDLEMESGSGAVTRIAGGKITLSKEVTR